VCVIALALPSIDEPLQGLLVACALDLEKRTS